MNRTITITAIALALTISAKSQDNAPLQQFAGQISTYIQSLKSDYHFKSMGYDREINAALFYIGHAEEYIDVYTIHFDKGNYNYQITIEPRDGEFAVWLEHEIGIYRTKEDADYYISLLPKFENLKAYPVPEDFSGMDGHMIDLSCYGKFKTIAQFKTTFPIYMKQLQEATEHIHEQKWNDQ